MSRVRRGFYDCYLLVKGQMRDLTNINMHKVYRKHTSSNHNSPYNTRSSGKKICDDVQPAAKLLKSGEVRKETKVKLICDDEVQPAASLLESGEVIGIPTDTVYGLACDANNPAGIQKMYDIKGRSCTKPISICVSQVQDLQYWGRADHLPEELLHSLLPGAVTIVVYKSHHLSNPYLNPGVDKIGIRVPNFDFIRKVTEALKRPIALTSANRSSQKSTLNVSEFEDLWPQLGMVYDGNQLGNSEEQRAASTVIDLSVPSKFKIIREGVAIRKTIQLLKKFNLEEIVDD